MSRSSIDKDYAHFNSIKVRLEHRYYWRMVVGVGHFNSIKVRLELIYCAISKTHIPQFQFHKGTIRTLMTFSQTEQYMISIP